MLAYFVGQKFKVKVISDDSNVLWLAQRMDCQIVTLEDMGEFDLFICIHGNKIIPKEYLQKGIWVNVHPCLFKYKGRNPVFRHIENKDTVGSVGCHYMIATVDEGRLIYEEKFDTQIVANYADFYNIALPFYFKVVHKSLEIIFNGNSD